MAKIAIEQIESWFDLTLRIDDYFTHYKDYIFRGQADAAWRLEPTLSRAIHKTYPKDKSKIEEWKEILFQFRANLRGRCNLDLNTATDDELWTLGQHYGLHTPMLDWTRSPYVAVFFSLLGPCASGERCIWALLEQDVGDLYGEGDPTPEGDRIAVVEPMTHHNPRLVSQRGLFLRIPPSQSLEQRVSKLKEQDHEVMYKFVFPDNVRDDAFAALDRRNINFASLFPDLNGAALYSNYEFEAEAHFEVMRKRGWPET